MPGDDLHDEAAEGGAAKDVPPNAVALADGVLHQGADGFRCARFGHQ